MAAEPAIAADAGLHGLACLTVGAYFASSNGRVSARLNGHPLARSLIVAVPRPLKTMMLRLLCTLLLAVTAAQAQTPSAERSPLTFGLALGPNLGGGGHLSASVTAQHGQFAGQAKFSGIDLNRTVATSIVGTARDSATEFALLGGYAQPIVERWQITGLIGMSALRVSRRASECVTSPLGCVPVEGDREVSPVLIGLPVEVGINGPVVGAFGVGVRAFATLNVEESYGGFSLDLRFNPARRSR